MVPIQLPREHKNEIIEQMQQFFLEERGEELGNLATEQIVDEMIKLLAPYVYNQAIGDVRVMISQKMDQIDEELYALERPIRNI